MSSVRIPISRNRPSIATFESKSLSGPGPLPGPRGRKGHRAGRANRRERFAPINLANQTGSDFGPIRRYPTLAVPGDVSREKARMLAAGVQGRHVLEALPAGAQEVVAVLDGDFLQRLETVDRETGAYHRHLAHSASGQLREHLAGVGLQPPGRPEARLEADAPLAVAQHQLFGEQARGFLTLAEIRIAVVEVALRYPVEGNQQVARAPVLLPVLEHAGAQGVDVFRLIVVFRDEAQLRQPAPAPELGAHLIVDRAGRRAAILRE